MRLENKTKVADDLLTDTCCPKIPRLQLNHRNTFLSTKMKYFNGQSLKHRPCSILWIGYLFFQIWVMKTTLTRCTFQAWRLNAKQLVSNCTISPSRGTHHVIVCLGKDWRQMQLIFPRNLQLSCNCICMKLNRGESSRSRYRCDPKVSAIQESSEPWRKMCDAQFKNLPRWL